MAQLISVRTSTLAVVKKTAEGTLTKPTAGNQFLAIQPDISFSPNFTTVENPEIKNDIMAGQVAISGEEPSATFSHLFKGSGTAGGAPAFGTLLESTFGTVRSQTADTPLATGSTKSILKMSNSNANKVAKGDTLLIKGSGGTNELMPVSGVSGTDVSLAFDIPDAVVSSIGSSANVGAFTSYVPKSTDLPVFDLWHYLGGGTGGLETLQDGRTVSVAISANAKENINGTYTLEGTAYRLNDTAQLRQPNNAFNSATNNYRPTVAPSFEQTAPVISRNQRLYVGSTSGENVCLNAPSCSFSITTPKTLLTSVCTPSGNFGTVINERTASMTVTTFLEENDARFFKKFQDNDKVSFFFAGGAKSGTNWTAGNCFGIYGSEASISAFSLSQVDNVWALEMTLQCYSPGDGSGSIFVSFC